MQLFASRKLPPPLHTCPHSTVARKSAQSLLPSPYPTSPHAPAPIPDTKHSCTPPLFPVRNTLTTGTCPGGWYLGTWDVPLGRFKQLKRSSDLKLPNSHQATHTRMTQPDSLPMQPSPKPTHIFPLHAGLPTGSRRNILPAPQPTPSLFPAYPQPTLSWWLPRRFGGWPGLRVVGSLVNPRKRRRQEGRLETRTNWPRWARRTLGRSIPALDGWQRDLVAEGIEPNPGPRYVTKNINGCRDIARWERVLLEVKREHLRDPVTAIFIQEHNITQLSEHTKKAYSIGFEFFSASVRGRDSRGALYIRGGTGILVPRDTI